MIPDFNINIGLLSTLVLSAIIAGLIVTAKEIPTKLYRFIKRRMVSTIMVDSTCEAYHLLNEWIEAQDFAKMSRSLMLENVKGSSRNITTSQEDEFMKGRLSSWRISMASGTYLFWYKKTLFFYTKSVKEQGVAKVPVYQSELLAFTRDREKLMSILEFCHGLLTNNSDTISIHSYSGYHWQMVDKRKPRPLDTIFLKEGQMERIIADVNHFYQAEEWYLHRGIPYRRAYLFEGPTGTGKTSTIVALATYFKKSIYLLNLSAMSSDKELMDAITSTPRDCFVVVEDVDCAQASGSRENNVTAIGSNEAPAKPMGITTSGLLNALDGITTPEGRLYFLTTNHPDKLDSALLRPGRSDVREHIGKLAMVEQVAMAQRFYENQTFEGLTIDVSPAVLIKAFMLHPQSAANAQAYLLENAA